MRTAASLLLILSLVVVPSVALLTRATTAPGDHETALSHQAQPSLVRAQTGTRLLSPRDFTLRDASNHLGRRESACPIANLSTLAGVSALATRTDLVLRI